MKVRTRIRLASEQRTAARALRREQSQSPTYRWRTFEGFIHPGECRGHLATTAHKQAIYPFVAQQGFGNRGVFVGPNLYGGAFALDPWEEYSEGNLHDPNMLVLGLKDFGKSSLCKTMAYRQNLFGRKIEVIDRKSEWRPVIEAMNGAVLRLQPGVRLNPLERVGSTASRQSLLRAAARTLLGRDLTPDERVGLSAALTAVDERYSEREVIIPDVVDELRNPSQTVAHELNVTRQVAGEKVRECMLVLRDMSVGPLSGMFDGPTTAGAAVWDKDALSIDISGIADHTHGADENTALAITMVCCTAFLDGRRRERADDRKTIRINDEAWRALSVPGMTDYYTTALKLSRQTGIMHILILHKLADLSAAGDDGSRIQKLAEGLAAEAAIRVIYRQSEKEAAITAAALQLSTTETEFITKLEQGDALWLLGRDSFLVRHQIARSEWSLIQTDEAMGERTPRTVGGG